MNYSFPLGFMFINFAMTILMIGYGLGGMEVLAADIGIVQGSTLALFYAFSSNARNIILNPASQMSVRSLLMIRLVLLVPVAGVAYYLSLLAGVSTSLALVLILRRCTEWLNEIHLSYAERLGDKNFVKLFIWLQGLLLFLVLIWGAINPETVITGLYVWALLPLFLSFKFFAKTISSNEKQQIILQHMLPHLGSTAIIGITVYVFRLLILLITNKQIAGDLFTAFAIGGILSSAFTNALGPSIVYHGAASGKQYFPSWLKISLALSLVMGIVIIVISLFDMNTLNWTGKNAFFWNATGLSLIGGVIMVLAQQIKLELLHGDKSQSVFGPDVIINILIIASIPFSYYFFGYQAFTYLFFFSSILSFMFYISAREQESLDKTGFWIVSDSVKIVLAAMLLLPLFFQFSSGIFRDPSMIFDSGSKLSELPVPLSVIACYGGILLLGAYKQAQLSISYIFLTFVLMVVASVISTHGQPFQEQAKFILLLQFVLPMFALILGQIYGQGKNFIFVAKGFCYTLMLVIPLHLVTSWYQGYLYLTPYLYVFSIYQHMQYAAILLVCAYWVALFGLWRSGEMKFCLLLLMPLMGIYAVASTSRLALACFVCGFLGFIYLQWKLHKSRMVIWPGFILFLIVPVYFMYMIQNKGKDVSFIYDKLTNQPSVVSEMVNDSNKKARLLPRLPERIYYWKWHIEQSMQSVNTFSFGHAKRPDRAKYPSAHNYYLDFLYNFGFIALLPTLVLVAYTLMKIHRYRKEISASMPLLGLSAVVGFLLLVDNSLKVGLRQPYPGILTFFLWGLLLSSLNFISAKTPVTHSN